MVLHQQKGWTGGSGWGHLQGDMHMVAARFGFQTAMLRLNLGSALESELGQKWRYSVLKACIG